MSYLTGGSVGAIFVEVAALPPQAEWTWTMSRVGLYAPDLEACGARAVKTVYAAACGKIYRLDTAADPPTPSPGSRPMPETDTAADASAPAYPMTLNQITGTDDVWFTGFRGGGQCPVVIHKTDEGYRIVVDGIPGAATCATTSGLPTIDGTFGYGISRSKEKYAHRRNGGVESASGIPPREDLRDRRPRGRHHVDPRGDRPSS